VHSDLERLKQQPKSSNRECPQRVYTGPRRPFPLLNYVARRTARTLRHVVERAVAFSTSVHYIFRFTLHLARVVNRVTAQRARAPAASSLAVSSRANTAGVKLDRLTAVVCVPLYPARRKPLNTLKRTVSDRVTNWSLMSTRHVIGHFVDEDEWDVVFGTVPCYTRYMCSPPFRLP